MTFQDISKSFLSFINSTPPNWLVYITIIVSFGMLSLRVVNFVKTRQDRSHDHVNSIIDEFWFRKVFSPHCINPLIDFITSELESLNQIDLKNTKGSFRTYNIHFQKEKEKIIRRFMLFSGWNNDVYDLVSKKLDDIDDTITIFCAEKENQKTEDEPMTFSDVENQVYSLFGLMLQDLTQKHLNMNPQ